MQPYNNWNEIIAAGVLSYSIESLINMESAVVHSVNQLKSSPISFYRFFSLINY